GDAVLTVLALVQGKALNWNARASSWDVSRQKMRSMFEKHNFSFKWTFAEFEGAQALYPWCRERVTAAYEGISQLYGNTATLETAGGPLQRQVTVTQGNAADMEQLSDRSVAHLCIDPPYYDNVMYAELSDFFYVWEKRTLGRIASGFDSELTDKDNEAI